MKFEPIELNGLTTFIVQSEVSDLAIRQLQELYKILIPEQGKIGTGIDKSKKDSLDLSVVPNQSTLIQREIMELYRMYVHYFSLENHIPPLAMTEHFNLQKYPLKGAFHEIHADRGYTQENFSRELIFMTYLNDVHTGGETEFMFYRLKIKPVRGLTLMWPAGWTHLHRGLPSPTTEKMIATGWLSPISTMTLSQYNEQQQRQQST
jgi:hypothetical protein